MKTRQKRKYESGITSVRDDRRAGITALHCQRAGRIALIVRLKKFTSPEIHRSAGSSEGSAPVPLPTGPWEVVEAEPALGFLISHEILTKTKVRVRNYNGPGRTSRRHYGTLLPLVWAYCLEQKIEKIYKSGNPPIGGFGARPAADRRNLGLCGRAGHSRYARPPSCVATLRGKLLQPYLLQFLRFLMKI